MLAGFSFGYNGVFATKTPYIVESATMNYSLWTNSVLWIVADSPVLNSGTTNAQWICYSKLCVSNGFQTSIASQPIKTIDGGKNALYFDGSDFLLIGDNDATVTNNTTHYFEIKPENVIGNKCIFGRYEGANSDFLILLAGDYLNIYANRGDLTSQINTAFSTNSFTKIAITIPSVTNPINVWKNGTNIYSGGAVSNMTTCNLNVKIGSYNNGSFYKGYIRNYQSFNRVLSTNEILELFK